jgi:2-amino-4-hydroxy-6-hydroxymethyldihydropteridine diphosphokinase
VILIGLGANIPGRWGDPKQSIERAIAEIGRWPIKVVRVSTLLDTDPFGKKNQPRYVNAVVAVATIMPPHALMRRLLQIERGAGRRRQSHWGPRCLDIDLLDYHGRKMFSSGPKRTALTLPHPGIPNRKFVLDPIAEIAPDWRHPITRATAAEMSAKL